MPRMLYLGIVYSIGPKLAKKSTGSTLGTNKSQKGENTSEFQKVTLHQTINLGLKK